MSMAPFRLSDPIQACPWKWRVTQRRPCLSIHLPCRTSCHVPPHFNFDIIEPRHHSATKDCGYLVVIRLQIPIDVGYTRQNVRPVMYIILDPFRCAKSSEKQETLLFPTANLNRDNSHRTSRYRGFSRFCRSHEVTHVVARWDEETACVTPTIRLVNGSMHGNIMLAGLYRFGVTVAHTREGEDKTLTAIQSCAQISSVEPAAVIPAALEHETRERLLIFF